MRNSIPRPCHVATNPNSTSKAIKARRLSKAIPPTASVAQPTQEGASTPPWRTLSHVDDELPENTEKLTALAPHRSSADRRAELSSSSARCPPAATRIQPAARPRQERCGARPMPACRPEPCHQPRGNSTAWELEQRRERIRTKSRELSNSPTCTHSSPSVTPSTPMKSIPSLSPTPSQSEVRAPSACTYRIIKCARRIAEGDARLSTCVCACVQAMVVNLANLQPAATGRPSR